MRKLFGFGKRGKHNDSTELSDYPIDLRGAKYQALT